MLDCLCDIKRTVGPLIDRMPNIFLSSSVFFVLSHAMFYVCLTMLVLVGSIVLGDPWLTRSLTVVLISEMYVVFI